MLKHEEMSDACTKMTKVNVYGTQIEYTPPPPPKQDSFLCTENTTKIMNKYHKNDFYCIELLQKRLYYILIFQNIHRDNSQTLNCIRLK